jgi:electron transport complex protein RnfD
MAFEYFTQKAMGVRPTITDGSAFLTGLLLAMNLPAGVPWYLPFAGSAVAIIITKQIFGGLGYNIFNPALIARAFLLASWPRLMTTWPVPNRDFSIAGIFSDVDAATAATPLAIIKEGGLAAFTSQFDSATAMYTQMMLGDTGGSLGEVSAIALLVGALYLLIKRYISWHIPFTFIGTVAIGSWALGGDPLLSVLSGGLILGAFFMATDYVTVPTLRRAQLIFGIGCGLLTILIRNYGGYPEGVCYAILLMNCFTPLLDRAFRTKRFGAQAAVRGAA